MRLFATLVLLTASVLPAVGDRLVPPRSMFRDPQFLKEFVGSYGILSDVEPKVSPEENLMLTKLRDLFEAGNFSQAESELVRFIKETEAPTEKDKKPAEISPAMVYVLGNLYFQADRFDEARRAFKEAIRRFPRFRRAHVNLAFLYISKNKFDEALPHLQRAVELGAGSHRVFGLLGYSYLLKKNPLAAENAYRQAYLLAPQNKDWKMGLAQALMMQDKLKEAVSLLDTLIAENPDDRQLWRLQANALLGLDKKLKAAEDLEMIRFKGLADEADLNLLGNIYMDQHQPQLALFAYLAAIEKSNKLDVDRALKSARILNDYGYPEKAAAFVARIRAKLGDSPSDQQKIQLLLVDVKIARSAGQSDRVGELLQQLVALDPSNGEVLLELARNYDSQSRDEKDENKRKNLEDHARTHFLLAAEDKSSVYQAKLGLGRLFVRQRRFTEALPVLEQALALRKSDSLDQYVGRVRRAADRQRLRKENEAEKRAMNAAARNLKQEEESKE